MKKIPRDQILTILLALILSIPAPALSAILQRNTDKTMTELSLEQLETFINGNTSKEQYLYIGRDDCPDCQKIFPTLIELNHTYHLGMRSYSTSQDRESRPDEMYEILDYLQVDSVPMILILKNGKVSERYSGDDFLALYAE